MERMTSMNKFKGIYEFKKIILNFKFRIIILVKLVTSFDGLKNKKNEKMTLKN
jgi:hypothetical protein